jgi:hypothetical protein
MYKIIEMREERYTEREKGMRYASQMSCMSPYSMPLWTIFTKCPAPSSPIHSQHGAFPSSATCALRHIPARLYSCTRACGGGEGGPWRRWPGRGA